MNPERPPIPEISSEQIDPRATVSPERRAAQDARHEAPESMAQKLQLWWKGDAHTHTQESTRPDYGYAEGVYHEAEILKYYQGLGLEFAAFTEHASKPGSPSIQSPDSNVSRSLLAEAERITEINASDSLKTIGLSGVEANIMFDAEGKPALDIPDEVLAKLDMVIASRHAIEREKEPAAVKETLLFAARHPQVDVIGHPDRYAKKDQEDPQSEYWQEYWAIWPEILSEMKSHNKAFEINMTSQPDKRLVQMAVEAGVPLFLDFDAHDFNQFEWGKSELKDVGEPLKKRWATNTMTETDEEEMLAYKKERLTHGPGVHALKRLSGWITYLESLGVTPDRVVNASAKQLITFLHDTHGRQTTNLETLAVRQEREA